MGVVVDADIVDDERNRLRIGCIACRAQKAVLEQKRRQARLLREPAGNAAASFVAPPCDCSDRGACTFRLAYVRDKLHLRAEEGCDITPPRDVRARHADHVCVVLFDRRHGSIVVQQQTDFSGQRIETADMTGLCVEQRRVAAWIDTVARALSEECGNQFEVDR